MKLRDGFVSNSSSSSFVVYVRGKHDYSGKAPRQISDADIKALKKYGFNTIKDKHTHEYHYGVTCNQDDVLIFLLEHNIPFEAECQYGTEHVFYDKNKDEVIEAHNYGVEASIYGTDDMMHDLADKTLPKEERQPVIKFTRAQYLKRIKL